MEKMILMIRPRRMSFFFSLQKRAVAAEVRETKKGMGEWVYRVNDDGGSCGLS